MTYKYVTIDGKTSGILARTKSNNGKARYITDNKRKPRLFYNLEIAKLTSKSIINDAEFEYLLRVDNVTVPIDNCQRMGKEWQFVNNDTLYIVKEYHLRKTTSLGYLCFENGATERCDRKYGSKRQSQLMNIIRDVIAGIICEKGTYRISTITSKGNSKHDHEEWEVQLAGTTGKIHILYVGRLMDINQAHRANNEKCFPFKKEMDRYLTFYVYTDKDISESARYGAEDKLQNVLEYIVCDLQDYYKEINAEYIKVDTPLYVEFVED